MTQFQCVLAYLILVVAQVIYALIEVFLYVTNSHKDIPLKGRIEISFSMLKDIWKLCVLPIVPIIIIHMVRKDTEGKFKNKN